MSIEQEYGPPEAARSTADFETILERMAERAAARIEGAVLKPFITSRECADLIGVTAEHLCAMRARGEGPVWSGKGKWIRYERRTVLEWLASLPRQKAGPDEGRSPPEVSSEQTEAQEQ